MKKKSSVQSVILFFGAFFLLSFSLEARVNQDWQKSWLQKVISQEVKQQILIQQKNPWEVIDTHIPSLARPSCKQALQQSGTLESRLEFCPELTSQIIWESETGERDSYPNWSSIKKERLNHFFQLIQSGRELDVQCPNPVEGVNVNFYELCMTEEEAFDIYAAHVANSLYLESTGHHPWSILNIPVAEMAVIFDSAYYHSRIRLSTTGDIILGRFGVGHGFVRHSREVPEAAGVVLSCDPRWSYRYLLGEYNSGMGSVLGTNEADTLKKLTWWYYKNAFHASDADAVRTPTRLRDYVFLRHRLQSQSLTINGLETPASGIMMRRGCHSAGLILLDLARSINLPILPLWSHLSTPPTNPYSIRASQHLGLAFQWARPSIKILHHVDDIYTYFRTFYPTDSMNTPVTDEESRSQIFFDATWLTPPTLRSYQYNIIEGFPPILPGEEVIPDIRGSTLMSGVNDGFLGGYWRHFEGSRTGLTFLDLERSYQLCTWNSYLSRFCESSGTEPGSLAHQIDDTLTDYRPWLSELPRLHTGSEHVERALVCIRAYGGCSTLRTSESDFYRGFGLGSVPH